MKISFEIDTAQADEVDVLVGLGIALQTAKARVAERTAVTTGNAVIGDVEVHDAVTTTTTSKAGATGEKPRKGRPPGSKNKKTKAEEEAEEYGLEDEAGDTPDSDEDLVDVDENGDEVLLEQDEPEEPKPIKKGATGPKVTYKMLMELARKVADKQQVFKVMKRFDVKNLNQVTDADLPLAYKAVEALVRS